jgi:hypothetical protein
LSGNGSAGAFRRAETAAEQQGSLPLCCSARARRGRPPPAPSCRKRPRAPGTKCRCARFHQRFTGRDDDAVTHQVVALRLHLALVLADAQAQAVGLGMQRVLNGSGTAQRLHRTGKLDEKAVSPVVLNSRPSCVAASGSITLERNPRTRANVPSSSQPIMAE